MVVRKKGFTQIGGRAKCWLDIYHWIPIWRWQGEYVTLDETFYSLLFKQEAVAAHSYCHIFFRVAFPDQDFIRNVIRELYHTLILQ